MRNRFSRRSKFKTPAPIAGTYNTTCDRTGWPMTNTEGRRQWDNLFVHHSIFEDRHPNDKPLHFPKEESMGNARPPGLNDAEYCYYTIRDTSNTLIGVYRTDRFPCGSTLREEATPAQVALYQPIVADQTFNVSDLFIASGYLVGTISATDASGDGLIFQILNTYEDAASVDYNNYIIPIDSSGQFRVRLPANLLSDTDGIQTFSVRVTTRSPGGLSDTATITVNITDEFDPDIYATSLLWLDAADAGTVTESGGLISNWADKSTNAFDFEQLTATNRPTYNTGYVTFDGVDNYLDCTSAASAWIQLSDGTDFTLIMVMKVFANPPGSAQSTILTTGATGSRFFQLRYDENLDEIAGGITNSGNNNVIPFDPSPANAIPVDTNFVLTITHEDNGTGSVGATIYSDGVSLYTRNKTANAYTLTDPSLTLRIGTNGAASSTEFANFDLYEMVIWPALLTPTQIAEIATILQTKHGI